MPQFNSEEAEIERFYDLQDLDITPKKKKKVIFMVGN